MPSPLPDPRCALTAPFHPDPHTCGRSALCGAFPEVTLAGRYPAPYLRGARTFLSDEGAAVQPTGLCGLEAAGGWVKARIAKGGPLVYPEAMIERPDSPCVDTICASPNHGDRRADIDCIILHYTGMDNGAAALARLCDADAEVSAHYLVWEDGRVQQLVAESRRAWHAGRSSWQGATDLNSISIGIEIVYPGHDFALTPYPPVQIAAVVALCRDIGARHAIAPERVLAHSDIAPGRKRDPGELFPWDVLHARGVGHWVAPIAVDDTDGAVTDASATLAVQRDLAAYGYAIDPTGVCDEATTIVVASFQRHFRPACVDGVIDASTRQTLRALLAAR